MSFIQVRARSSGVEKRDLDWTQLKRRVLMRAFEIPAQALLGRDDTAFGVARYVFTANSSACAPGARSA